MTQVPFALGSANVIWTGSRHGNLGHLPPRAEHDEYCCGADATARRAEVRPGEWIYVTQVHGGEVEIADETSRGGECEADGLVTETRGVTLAISTADCSPIALSSREGVVAAVHGGWRSLQSGIIGTTAAIMRRMGATDIAAALGPCIHVECYEFDDEAMRPMVALWGEAVRGRTSWGTPALDMTAAVGAACKASDIELAHVSDECTGCSTAYFSHRARGDRGRQVMLVWRTDEARSLAAHR